MTTQVAETRGTFNLPKGPEELAYDQAGRAYNQAYYLYNQARRACTASPNKEAEEARYWAFEALLAMRDAFQTHLDKARRKSLGL